MPLICHFILVVPRESNVPILAYVRADAKGGDRATLEWW
jgi:hypothetical protein